MPGPESGNSFSCEVGGTEQSRMKVQLANARTRVQAVRRILSYALHFDNYPIGVLVESAEPAVLARIVPL